MAGLGIVLSKQFLYNFVMAKKTVTFIATRYKNKPVRVSFYTRDGDRVKFTALEKMSAKTRVQFRAKNR